MRALADTVHSLPTGTALLEDPIANRGTAFTSEERIRLGLDGLLPPVVETLEQQCARAYEAYRRKADDLERHIYLRALQDNNETLCYAVLRRHLTEMVPVVYTPVVAQACAQFSQIYRRPRGLFLQYPMADRLEALLENRPRRDVEVIVVTDGERVLGIGDQGTGGMGISIGKLQLYTLFGGIEPSRTLPICLDVGTNNPERLAEPDYIGWRHERVGGDAYFDFVDRFVTAVKRVLPGVLLQWEDFARDHAAPLLERYRDQLCTFNDDIQGTASVVVAALIGALGATGGRFGDQRIVIAGAGSAGVGLAAYLLQAMRSEGVGEEGAHRRIFLVDRQGLIHDRLPDLTPGQRAYAQPFEAVSGFRHDESGRISLDAVLEATGATVLLGVSAQCGLFDETAVRAMAARVERPIIFPLSNPLERCEATPHDLLRWTDGRALIATGSPYAPVTYAGVTRRIAQCNNVYIFPAVGLGVLGVGARRVTDGMMLAAARALGARSPARKDPSAPLLPALDELPGLTQDIALAVAREAQESGMAPASSEDAVRAAIAARFWTPSYRPLL
ncbi:MAG TPA: NAD-dependent malic enzyme [Myxococcaceae bacterium]|nr:NAD-dependent malic enzyme [Myxococcaceae bacterium]